MRSILLAGLCVFGWLMFTPSEVQAQSRSSRDVVIRGGDRGRDGDIRVIRDRRGRLIVLDDRFRNDRFRNDGNSDDDSSDDGRSNRRRFGSRRYPLDRGYYRGGQYRGGQVLFERNGVAVLVDPQGNLVLGLPRSF